MLDFSFELEYNVIRIRYFYINISKIILDWRCSMPSIYINNVGEITFDKEVLDAANIKPGDDVLIQETEEGLVISKVQKN